MDHPIPETLNQSKKLLVVGVIICVVLLMIYVVLRMNQRTSVTETREPIIPTLTPAPSVPPNQAQSPRDEQFVEEYTSAEAMLRPDLLIHNSTPYENEYFTVKTVFVEDTTEYFKIIVEAKEQDMNTVETQFRSWLVSLNIPDASISKLNVEYILTGIPKAFE